MAQFYPDSSGTWCIRDFNNSSFMNITMEMRSGQDTLMNGRVYKYIDEYHSDIWSDPEFIRTYYVRSDTSGKGYIFLLDQMQEYLTGDLNVIVGDTIENVYMGDVNCTGGITDNVVVDNVVVLTNETDTVTRIYVRQPCIGNSFNFIASFWQSGMGCSYGYSINYNDFRELTCVVADGHYAYSTSIPGNDATQLPAVPCECASITTGIDEQLGGIGPVVHPNPSSGQFLLSHLQKANRIAVYTSTGQKIWEGSGNTIDLTAQPPGVYTAVVTTERGRQAVRLVVVR